MTEKKPFVVLDINCGTGEVASEVFSRRDLIRNRRVKYIGIDDLSENPKNTQTEQSMKKISLGHLGDLDFHVAKLAFHDEKRLKEQLKEALKGEMADEVHFHFNYAHQVTVPRRILAALSEITRKEARVYNIVDPFAASIAGQLNITDGSPEDVIETHQNNSLILKKNLQAFGFRLEKYGIRTDTRGKTAVPQWHVNKTANDQTNRRINRLLKRRTAYLPLAHHYVVVKKM